jgi:hypothetical protein
VVRVPARVLEHLPRERPSAPVRELVPLVRVDVAEVFQRVR